MADPNRVTMCSGQSQTGRRAPVVTDQPTTGRPLIAVRCDGTLVPTDGDCHRQKTTTSTYTSHVAVAADRDRRPLLIDRCRRTRARRMAAADAWGKKTTHVGWSDRRSVHLRRRSQWDRRSAPAGTDASRRPLCDTSGSQTLPILKTTRRIRVVTAINILVRSLQLRSDFDSTAIRPRCNHSTSYVTTELLRTDLNK